MGRSFFVSRSAPYVVAAHGRGDVRVKGQQLTARRDERDEHDQRDQSKDERVLNHSLALLDVSKMNQQTYRPESLTVEPRLLVAYTLESLLHDHPHHPLAPEVAEIGVIQRFGRLRSDLRRSANRVCLQAFSFQEFFSRLSLERVGRDRGQDDPAGLDHVTFELDSDRSARDGKVDRTAAPQLDVRAPCPWRPAQPQTGHPLIAALAHVQNAMLPIERGNVELL